MGINFYRLLYKVRRKFKGPLTGKISEKGVKAFNDELNKDIEAAYIDDEDLYQEYLADYFKSRLSFEELVRNFENMSLKNRRLIRKATDIKDLEKIVRENNIFNMND